VVASLAGSGASECDVGHRRWLFIEFLRTVAFDRAGLPFRVLSAQEDDLGAGLPSGPIPMAAPFYLGTDRASPGIMLHTVPVFLSAE
jgi:hypothetical protein